MRDKANKLQQVIGKYPIYDKNGKEITAGSLVKTRFGSVYKVIFSQGIWKLRGTGREKNIGTWKLTEPETLEIISEAI